MFDRIFANYLLEKGKLSDKNLSDIFSIQDEKRVRLGVIAVSEKLMSIDQVEEINQLQAINDKRFGDIAIESGYLTEEEVKRLLFLQGNSFLAFIQSMIDLSCMTMEEVNEALEDFQKENSFTLMNMEDLKSCDIDRIIPIYLYQQEDMLRNLCGIMVRTVSRLVDYHVYIKKPYAITECPCETLCMQELNGDHTILTALAGAPDTMQTAAVLFAGAEYISDKEDSLDALCELINCVNGLLATEMSLKGIEIDMKAPHYNMEPVTLHGDSLVCLPLFIEGKELSMIMSLDADYSL